MAFKAEAVLPKKDMEAFNDAFHLAIALYEKAAETGDSHNRLMMAICIMFASEVRKHMGNNPDEQDKNIEYWVNYIKGMLEANGREPRGGASKH